MSKKLKPIPRFSSEAEERKFWETTQKGSFQKPLAVGSGVRIDEAASGGLACVVIVFGLDLPLLLLLLDCGLKLLNGTWWH